MNKNLSFNSVCPQDSLKSPDILIDDIPLPPAGRTNTAPSSHLAILKIDARSQPTPHYQGSWKNIHTWRISITKPAATRPKPASIYGPKICDAMEKHVSGRNPLGDLKNLQVKPLSFFPRKHSFNFSSVTTITECH